MTDPERARQKHTEAVRPSSAGRRRGRLIPIAIFVVVLLIFLYIILVARSNG